jgi:hypothetical protein
MSENQNPLVKQILDLVKNAEEGDTNKSELKRLTALLKKDLKKGTVSMSVTGKMLRADTVRKRRLGGE